MGRVSREARLLFVQLWTICDDEGKTRAASRMLASLLYPYDDDAPRLIGGWLDELEREGAIRRYEVDGDSYLDVPKWHKHQKIDRPSKSRLPDYAPNSRVIAKPREGSSTDLGPGSGPGMDLEGKGSGPGRDPARVLATIGEDGRAITAEGAWNPTGKPIQRTEFYDGADRRRHGMHAFCGRVCVPWGLHAELINRLGSADADQRLRAWYPAVMAKFEGREIGDDLFQFWKNEFSAWVGTVTSRPATGSKTGDSMSAAKASLTERLGKIQAEEGAIPHGRAFKG